MIPDGSRVTPILTAAARVRILRVRQLLFLEVGAGLGPAGTGFISLIQMLIAPVIFCTVVTTVALVVGLIVMDVVSPGAGVHADPDELTLTDTAQQYVQTGEGQHWYDFLIKIIPDSVVGAFTEGNVLQVLLISILFAIAIRALGERGEPLVRGIARVGDAVFGVVKLIMYLAPLGAFGAMAYATGKFGVSTLASLGGVVVLFWVTGIVFCLVVFGIVARLCGLRILPLYRYPRPGPCGAVRPDTGNRGNEGKDAAWQGSTT